MADLRRGILAGTALAQRHSGSAGRQRSASQAKGDITMRFDLLEVHDRFIPGWHLRRKPPRAGAEYMLPAWRLPLRPSALITETTSRFRSIAAKLRAAMRCRLDSSGRLIEADEVGTLTALAERHHMGGGFG